MANAFDVENLWNGILGLGSNVYDYNAYTFNKAKDGVQGAYNLTERGVNSLRNMQSEREAEELAAIKKYRAMQESKMAQQAQQAQQYLPQENTQADWDKAREADKARRQMWDMQEAQQAQQYLPQENTQADWDKARAADKARRRRWDMQEAVTAGAKLGTQPKQTGKAGPIQAPQAPPQGFNPSLNAALYSDANFRRPTPDATFFGKDNPNRQPPPVLNTANMRGVDVGYSNDMRKASGVYGTGRDVPERFAGMNPTQTQDMYKRYGSLENMPKMNQTSPGFTGPIDTKNASLFDRDEWERMGTFKDKPRQQYENRQAGFADKYGASPFGPISYDQAQAARNRTADKPYGVGVDLMAQAKDNRVMATGDKETVRRHYASQNPKNFTGRTPILPKT